MAILYVDDGGSNTSPFNTWAKAATDLDTAFDDAAAVAGSTIYVGHNSTSTYGGNVTYASNGTLASPIVVISADNTSGEPPSTYTAGAIEDADAGAYDIIFSGHSIYYGITFKAGDDIGFSGNDQQNILYNCTLELNGESAIDKIYATSEGAGVELYNTNVSFNNAGHEFRFGGRGAVFKWHGGALSFDINVLIDASTTNGFVSIQGVDLSAMSGGAFLDTATAATLDPITAIIEGCKLNATIPTLFDGVIDHRNVDAKLINCHSGNVPYFEIETREGQIIHESSIYRAGADPSSNNFSAKIITTANAAYHRPLKYKLADVWCSANPTLTVECVHDSQGDGTGGLFHDDEYWLEIQYPTNVNAAYRQWDRTGKPDPLDTPGDQGSDAGVSWTGTGGFGSAVEQRLAETISGGAAGIHSVWVCLNAGGNVATAYFCPQIGVS